MKRIKVTLTRVDGNEMLKVTEPLFFALKADRFVIDDQRRTIKKVDPISKRRRGPRAAKEVGKL